MSIFQKQREHVGQKILETSIDLFRKNGYENTTIDEITKEVGIAKGTFYNFYTSKNDVLMKWAVQVFQRLDVQEAFRRDRTFRQNIEQLVLIIVRNIQEEESLFVNFIKELAIEQGMHNRETQFDFAGIMEKIADVSADHARIIGSDETLKINVLNDSLFMAIIRWFNMGKEAIGLEDHLQEIVRVCFHGILFSNEDKQK